jgi:diketogulonate reductase-like aldo/keto reductase
MTEHDDAGYLDGLADAYEQGLVKAVGVSNYNGLYHVLNSQK